MKKKSKITEIEEVDEVERRRGLNIASSAQSETTDERNLLPLVVAPRGALRTLALFRAMLVKRSDPELYRRIVLTDTMNQVVGKTPLYNRNVLEIADGETSYAAGLVERGAHVTRMRREAVGRFSWENEERVSKIDNVPTAKVDDSSVDAWKQAAIQAVAHLAKSRPTVTSNDVWERLEQLGVVEPPTPSAMGAIFRQAAKEAYLTKTGGTVETRRSRSNQQIAVWHSEICEPAVDIASAVTTLDLTFNALRIPVEDRTFDLVFGTNVLSSVANPKVFIDEIVRVTRPGGTIYLQNATWFSPGGGDETSPLHFISGRLAQRRYVVRHGHSPRNVYRYNFFRISIKGIMAHLHGDPRLVVVGAHPRYLPETFGWLLRVPILNELITMNLVIRLEKKFD
ncbi:MAG: methyltransferase domain-containing protein [Actinomycetes bacterium]